MKACALFIYGDQYEYLNNLTSPKASARLLFNTLRNNSSSYLPEWMLLNEPKPIRDSADLVSIFNNFEKEIHLYDSDVVYVYISGHGYSVEEGEIFIYSNNSQVGDIETGLKITSILSILCNRKLKHIVLCLDLCRTFQGKVTFKNSLINELKKIRPNFNSLIIITSTVEGETSYGGLKNSPTPFAIGLNKMLSKEYIETPILHFENILKKILIDEYLKTKLIHSDPEFIPIPKDNNRNIFGFYIANTASKEIDISTFQSVDLFVDKIIDREKKSLISDSFISNYNDLIPLSVKIREQIFSLEELIIENNNPIIIEGESGSGKTISAKRTSYFIATEFKNSRIKKIAIYFNAGFLNNYDLTRISIKEILNSYFEKGRYFIKLNDIESFLKEFELVLIVDGIEDLKDKSTLVPFLRNCKAQLASNYIIFCQPYDKGWLQKELASKFINTGKIEPISLSDIKRTNIALYERTNKSIKTEILPLELQLLKKYVSSTTSEEITIKQILLYEYDKIKQRIEDRIDRKKFFDLNEQYILKRNTVQAYRMFALALREIGSFQFFRKQDGEILFQSAIRNFDFFPLDYSEFIEIGIRANLFYQDDVTTRYSHRSSQELLIAYEWINSKPKNKFFINKCKSSLWGSTIATFSVLVDKNDFPYSGIVKKNPVLIVQCINRGYEPSNKETELLIENLLKKSSHWTRNETAKLLTKLPLDISERLIDLYQNEIDFDRKTSIAIALGSFNNCENINFLISEYEKLLREYNDLENQYLRRRILDVLKEKYDVKKIFVWDKLNQSINIKEWARILRSVNINNYDEIKELTLFISEHFSGLELFLLEVILSSKKQIMTEYLNKQDNANRIKLSNNLIYLLELDGVERLYKCIPALIIEELKLVDLGESLLNALKKEKDIYAIGEISYVLGVIGDKSIINNLLIYIAGYINTEEFQIHYKNAKYGFFNDLKQGLLHAIYNHKFDKEISIDFLPKKIKLSISNAISVHEETP